MRYRLDLYGQVVRGPWTLAADAPLMHNRILDDPATPPVPCSSDYCANLTSVGEAGLELRYTRAWVTPMLAVRTDFWNAGTRHRWANAGLGATSVVGRVGLVANPGEWRLSAVPYYALVIGTEVNGERLPYDHTGAALTAAHSLGPTWTEVTLSGMTRLGGVDHGPEWTAAYGPEWIWAGLRYQELRAEVKTGMEIRGLWWSLYASRVLVQRNGPRDAWSFGVGAARTVRDPG